MFAGVALVGCSSTNSASEPAPCPEAEGVSIVSDRAPKDVRAELDRLYLTQLCLSKSLFSKWRDYSKSVNQAISDATARRDVEQKRNESALQRCMTLFKLTEKDDLWDGPCKAQFTKGFSDYDWQPFYKAPALPTEYEPWQDAWAGIASLVGQYPEAVAASALADVQQTIQEYSFCLSNRSKLCFSTNP